ncbi:cyclase family protein [bacterium]|nr:cyclase family protein [bacterium]
MLIDITRSIGVDTVDYPGDPATELEAVAMVAVQGYMLSRISASLHLGTHIDAPAHFVADGPAIHEIPLERFILSAHVVEVETIDAISPRAVEQLQILEGDAVLFKTLNGELQRESYVEHHAYVSLETAQYLLEQGAALVGIDYVSIERGYDEDFPVHKLLSRYNVLILEDLDLRQVKPGRYTLHCLPLKIGGAEAAPCRAVLMTL